MRRAGHRCRAPRTVRELANALIDASLAAADRDGAAARAFERLLEHAAAHFAHEEALLARRGFAQLDAHRRAHAGLLGRAQALRQAWRDGAAGLGAIVEFLAGDLVARHLFKADREFFFCLPMNLSRHGEKAAVHFHLSSEAGLPFEKGNKGCCPRPRANRRPADPRRAGRGRISPG
ncbi:MAG: hemerythrin domain-containing protein [Zoogloeaceae bacterium]|nr:hemerythrin domain-containing protein [Zoogloeaceae bacterium]